MKTILQIHQKIKIISTPISKIKKDFLNSKQMKGHLNLKSSIHKNTLA